MLGYLDDNSKLTDSAQAIFKSHAPQNAIILAAEFGMRMVPINMITPKALLEVNGERLIDRLITQLHEVGITDITVVIGFMKDSFEYLIDDFGVKLVYAADYASTNNIHSLVLAADQISNTYIISSDIWCNQNPFSRQELYSWYMVTDIVDDHSDVRLNRKMELVKIPENSGGNGMIGISYLTGKEAETVKQRILDYAADSSYDDKFWEEALYSCDRMLVRAKVVHGADVVEINTYEQLRELDANSNQLKSDAIDVIAETFGCETDDIVDIEVLKKGMTNRSFLFRINKGEKAGKYIMRIPGEGTDQLIDRAAEALVYKTISGFSLCDDPVYINPQNGYKITAFLEDVRTCDSDDVDDLKKCMTLLKKFHHMKLSVPHTFDIFKEIDFYENLWEGDPSMYEDYAKTKENVLSLKPFLDGLEKDWCLTHIDANQDNFLFYKTEEGQGLQLTDWEYAGMQDPHVDVAMFCIYAMYNKEQIDRLIDIYFDGQCDRITRAKIYAYIAMCGLLWSNWCEYKRKLGVEFGEYSLSQYQYAKDYYQYTKELMGNDL